MASRGAAQHAEEAAVATLLCSARSGSGRERRSGEEELIEREEEEGDGRRGWIHTSSGVAMAELELLGRHGGGLGFLPELLDSIWLARRQGRGWGEGRRRCG
jgi:hypothetical protein